MTQVATYRADHRVYRADACEPLKAAMASGLVRVSALARGLYPGRPLREGQLPGLRNVGVWDATRPQRWGLPRHRNEGVEIACLLRGKLAFSVGQRHHSLRPGQMTLTRPWQPHQLGDPDVAPSRLIWVILDVGVRRPNAPWVWPDWVLLDAAERDRLAHVIRHTHRCLWPTSPALLAAFERLAGLLESDPQPVATRIMVLLNELLLDTLATLTDCRPRLDVSLTTAVRTVELFLHELPQRLDEPWTLSTMAAACGLGRSRFAQLCTRLTNRSPHAYLLRCRVHEAARLLRDQPEKSITQIALACGFASSQYFATAFKREMGVTPREHRAATE